MGRLSEFLNSTPSSSNPAPPPAYNVESASSSNGETKPAPVPTKAFNNDPPPAFPHLFACLHLGRTDRLRLIGLPPNAVPAVEEAIRRVWTPGVQARGPYHQGYEWKLSGRPWQGQGFEAIAARRLMSHVLHALSAIGWDLHQACDLSKKGFDKDTLILHSVPPRQKYYFSISFNESDKIRIIDPPNEYVKDTFIRAVHTWQYGIQTSHEKEPGAWQLKLRGNPWWTSDGVEVVQARLLACTILSAMESVGFELVGSVDMSIGNGEHHLDLDTWFFASKV